MVVKHRKPGLSGLWHLPVLATGANLLAPMIATASESYAAADLAEMSIEELGNIEVTSVSKRAEPLSAAPAAIYVITNEDIRRQGSSTIAEALRLAPNLQVAQLDALSYAISARGSNSAEASNKLLVLVDGRSVYSPLHSGVFWDVQDVVMDDIERIEVVGGPGGTLWGANAVNGVINIITKSAADTTGGSIRATYGSLNQSYSARYGFAPTESFAYRGYVKGDRFGHTRNTNGTNHIDDWERVQGGFRADWKSDTDKASVQGNFYEGGLDVTPSIVSGQNVTANWSHDFDGTGPLQVLAYYDRTHRDQPAIILETVTAYNVELQHSFGLGARHQIIWGGGYRHTTDFYGPPAPFGVVNPGTSLDLGNVFVQDEITLTPTLKATAGVKVEHHTYTGFEYMPNARLSWQPTPQNLVWAAVSRAVRTPSHLDRELQALPILLPAPNFASETLLAYELGYRGQFMDRVTFSISGFYNDYDDVRATTITSFTPLQGQLKNGLRVRSYGVEAWGQYKVVDWWRLSGGVTALNKDLTIKPGFNDASNFQGTGNDPDYQVKVRSLMSPLRNLDVDVTLRAIGDLPAPATDGYVEMDARIGWRVTDDLELSVAAFNLLHDQHGEGGPTLLRREIRRSVQGSVRWTF